MDTGYKQRPSLGAVLPCRGGPMEWALALPPIETRQATAQGSLIPFSKPTHPGDLR